MAKITISRIFEVSLIATSKAYGELQPFIDYVNSLADNTIRILRNGVTLADNINCEIITQKLTPGTDLTFAVKARPVGVIILQSDQAVTSFVWQTGEGNQITAKITSAWPTSFNVKMCVFYS